MKVLVVHNYYQQPGGEDVVFQAESSLLERHGHQVVRFSGTNDDLGHYSHASLASNAIWNRASLRVLRDIVRRTRPDVMHVHNTFPLLSPAVYSAARADRVPVVQTLHNFRLLCPNAMLYRDGHVCEDCIGTSTRWPSVVHACYRNNRVATGVVAAMVSAHGAIGTWQSSIDRFIAMSQFAKTKFVQGGYPAEKIVVKPNFLDVVPTLRTTHRDYVLFVGRLTREKGVNTLLAAVQLMSHPPLLKIAGQGPLMPLNGRSSPGVEWLGHQTHEQILELMRGAAVLIIPSEWYEGCPLTMIEAFAIGVPVIASRLGSMAEMISGGLTGLHFTAGDPEDLARTIAWGLTHPGDLEEMARRARVEFERRYTAAHNYLQLIDIYSEAIHECSVQDVGRVSWHWKRSR